MSVFLTSVGSESLERHRLLVVVILILPDVVSAVGAAPAAVAEVGHDHTRHLSQQKHPKFVQHWHAAFWGGARKVPLRHTHRSSRPPETSDAMPRREKVI